LSAAVLLTGCQTPTGSAAARATSPATQQASGDLRTGKICKSVVTTGSRFPTKQCYTAVEWAQMKVQGGDDLVTQDPPHAMGAK
jgi:hypothetical protein